jgi:hypothetical protein
MGGDLGGVMCSSSNTICHSPPSALYPSPLFCPSKWPEYRLVLYGNKPSGPAVLLGVGPAGSFWLNFSDKHFCRRATVSLDADGNSAVILRDSAERKRIELSLPGDGSAVSRLLDAKGDVVWSAP